MIRRERLMANLYELTGDLLELQSMANDDSVDPEVLADTLEAVEGDYTFKLESYCKVIKNLESDMEGLAKEIERLKLRKLTIQNNITKMKGAMFDSMKATDTPKVKGELFTVAIQKNGGKAPVVLDVKDTSELPDELVRIKEEPDMDALRALIEKDGECKYAHLGERGESLRIK